MSRYFSKILANSLSAVGAFLCLLLLFAVFNQSNSIDDVGDYLVKYHSRVFRSKAEEIRQYLIVGQTDSAMALLEAPIWQNVLKGDRIYPVKRRLLSHLCKQLHKDKDYRNLRRWASEWRYLDELDPDAIAYWYEALRHSADRHDEGFQGLIRESYRIPTYQRLSTNLLIAAHRENGNLQAAEQLLTKRAEEIAERLSSGWELFWTIATKQDEYKLYSRVYSISSKANGMYDISFKVPSSVVRLRLDPPGYTSLELSDIQFEIDGIVHSLLTNDFYLNQMQHSYKSIVSNGQQDPYFEFDPRSYLKNRENFSVDMTLRFRVTLVIGNDRVLLPRVR